MHALAEALTGLQYSNRFPTFAEYQKAAPIERRAIIERWRQIVQTAAQGDWWPNEPDESIRAKSCLWAAGAYGPRPVKPDEYDRQIRTGAIISDGPETVSVGDQVGD